ncbi:MAG: hypothetical protein A2747_01575 [Candidatus Yonathbacteria bacterium RIFCSPHIGHO2_01_FULL_44_41]|uniref:Uncharacterized protein n=1 Tax=Candidatus Yonathbacteria bacterium RIFCSPHIGHO2_02_FULL_44_14 TaxID=1802724 RepID=A0A1G2SA05_9BACT|nr:MAG: hypothetical protein A2747_01575 [Candidatus Yonathbacteria bacterium RIFCSPHIGHO2_01_FULL_44_41]OHA81896.1 MAG: hypothetical protein A3D51_03935 [Candidatus Yonathbacteria bacterium RIFCSPHIGHO2_02_FULL_44_14]OHA82426.1 MAG: hypothetical protein A3B06_00795 [Candidatus Yonathbacteria bacterium RIFCSPLOWO2_01_FULL_43_20]
MKKLSKALALAIICAIATPAFADGDSWTNGSVGGGASVVNGVGGFSANYQGSAGTNSWDYWYWGGTTQVSAAGGTNGYVMGNGSVNGNASSGASAQEWGGYTNTNSGSYTGSSASVWGGGIASSSAGASAGGSASSNGWWWW